MKRPIRDLSLNTVAKFFGRNYCRHIDHDLELEKNEQEDNEMPKKIDMEKKICKENNNSCERLSIF